MSEDSFAREAARRANVMASEAKTRSQRAYAAQARQQKEIEEFRQEVVERLEVMEAKTRAVRDLGHCVFCGAPTIEGLACRAHGDLLGHD